MLRIKLTLRKKEGDISSYSVAIAYSIHSKISYTHASKKHHENYAFSDKDILNSTIWNYE